MINLNDTVTVTLTKRGAEILNDDAKEFNSKFSLHLKDSHKEGDEYENQLWCMFERFGEFCSAGSESVFTNLRKV